MNTLGKNIRYLRKLSSKTQSDIALMLNKGQTTIGNWENGVSEPSIEELVVISNYFGISIDALIKFDLASDRKGAASGNAAGLPYDHSNDSFPVIGENAEDWPNLHEEVKRIRKELQYIYTQLPQLKGSGQIAKSE